jgi:hypothetical protein
LALSESKEARLTRAGLERSAPAPGFDDANWTSFALYCQELTPNAPDQAHPSGNRYPAKSAAANWCDWVAKPQDIW